MGSGLPKSNHTGRHEPKVVYTGSRGILFQGDCLALLEHIVPRSIDLVFADPPFNLGKAYETEAFSDNLQIEEYRRWCHNWLDKLIECLKPGGSFFLYHWPKWLIEFGNWLNSDSRLEYRSWIAVKMKSGFPIRNRLHPAHYGLLYYTKVGARPTFNVVRQKSPVCRHCGREVRDYGGYRDKFKKYEDGDGIPWVQIADFWEDTHPARQDKSRNNRIAELPLHIPERAILLASRPGDIVLDVFGGSGSTYHAAQLHERLWIGCEIADTTPILRRIKTVFGLELDGDTNQSLLNCFGADFINPKLESFRKYRRVSLQKVRQFEDKPDSFNELASKSKVLGY